MEPAKGAAMKAMKANVAMKAMNAKAAAEPAKGAPMNAMKAKAAMKAIKAKAAKPSMRWGACAACDVEEVTCIVAVKKTTRQHILHLVYWWR